MRVGRSRSDAESVVVERGEIAIGYCPSRAFTPSLGERPFRRQRPRLLQHILCGAVLDVTRPRKLPLISADHRETPTLVPHLSRAGDPVPECKRRKAGGAR